jgi:hypothetical protein
MISQRGQFVDVTEQINLTVKFKDQSGNTIDTDSFPKVSIVQPDGSVLLAPTSVGVSRVDTGYYSYIFTVPINGPYGVFHDVWTGYINGFKLETSFEFIVAHTDLPGINSDGYVALGDDPGFNYSQSAIKNINKLIKSLRARLNSSGKAKATDGYGNVIYVSCDIFSVDMLVTFLGTALWDFNQIPYFTEFTFDDDSFIDQFGEILVERATMDALTSKALIEAGRKFNISDQGISFTPPDVSDVLGSQYGTLLGHYWEKVKYIKNSLRPGPKLLGTFSMQSSTVNPSIRQLSHRRAGQII